MGQPSFDQICQKVSRPWDGPLSKYVEFEKTKKWNFSQKETKNPNSEQYQLFRMIFEHTEAFRINFMGTSKSWIQVLKTRWAGPGPAHGRLTFDMVGRPRAGFRMLNLVFEIGYK